METLKEMEEIPENIKNFRETISEEIEINTKADSHEFKPISRNSIFIPSRSSMPRRVSYTPKRRSTVNKSADSLITINRVLKPIPERRSSSSRSVHTVDYHMERKMSELEKSLGRKDRQTFEKKFKESDIERKLREELKIIQAAENRLSQVNYKMEEKIANLQMQVVLGEQEIQQRKLKESDMEAIIWEETRRASAAQKKLNSLNLLGDYRKLQTEMDGLLQSLHDMERELKLRKEKEITTESDNRDALRRAEATEKKLLVQINHLELEIKQHREKVNKLQKALTNAEGINQKTRMKEIDLETAHQDELKRHQGAERKLSGMNNYMAVRIEQLEEKIEKLNNQLKQRDRDAFQARAKETDLETKLKNVQKHKEVMEKKLTGSKMVAGADLRKLEEKVDSLQKMLTDKEETIGALLQKEKDLEKRMKEESRRAYAAEHRLTTAKENMREEFESLEQKLKKLEQAYHEKDDELYNMKVRVAEMDESVKCHRHRASLAERKLTSLGEIQVSQASEWRKGRLATISRIQGGSETYKFDHWDTLSEGGVRMHDSIGLFDGLAKKLRAGLNKIDGSGSKQMKVEDLVAHLQDETKRADSAEVQLHNAYARIGRLETESRSVRASLNELKMHPTKNAGDITV